MDSNDTLFPDDPQLKVLRRKLDTTEDAILGTRWIGDKRKLWKRANGLQQEINDRVESLTGRWG